MNVLKLWPMTCWILSLVGTGHAHAEKLIVQARPSTQTRSLLAVWQKEAEKTRAQWKSESKEQAAALKKLLLQCDADLAFLEFMDANNLSGGWPFHDCSTELGKLNSQRTYDTIVRRLSSKDAGHRRNAILFLENFKKRNSCVPLLVKILEQDPDREVRSTAITVLARLQDMRAESALLKVANENTMGLAFYSVGALAMLNSADSVAPALAMLQAAKDDHARSEIVRAMRGFRRKAVINAVLEVYSRTPKVTELRDGRARFAAGESGLLQREASFNMWYCFDKLEKLNGPQPDDLYEQWQDWWDRTEPLLTDDLKLKTPLNSDAKYADADFGRDPNDLELTIAVDSETFRYRDPIRLDLKIVNRSNKPYRIIPPTAPSPARPTLAYGISLRKDGEEILQVAASDDYLGSSPGPATYVILGPDEEFSSSVCLQYFLDRIRSPFGVGEYELGITWDSTKRYGHSPRGIETSGSWTAKPIKFKVEGDARTDTKEIFELISQKARLPFMRTDLLSTNGDRNDRARRALMEYCDKRLAADDTMPEWMRKSYEYLRD